MPVPAKTLMFCTLTSHRPTTTSPVRRPPLEPLFPSHTHSPTHHRPTHPAADDRSKNLRPKRNIKTAMQHEIMLYGIAQKEQMGFDKAVEVRPKPPQTLTNLTW